MTNTATGFEVDILYEGDSWDVSAPNTKAKTKTIKTLHTFNVYDKETKRPLLSPITLIEDIGKHTLNAEVAIEVPFVTQTASGVYDVDKKNVINIGKLTVCRSINKKYFVIMRITGENENIVSFSESVDSVEDLKAVLADMVENTELGLRIRIAIFMHEAKKLAEVCKVKVTFSDTKNTAVTDLFIFSRTMTVSSEIDHRPLLRFEKTKGRTSE